MCPTTIRVVRTVEPVDLLLEQEQSAAERILQACLDPKTKTLFTLVRTSDNKKVIRAQRGPELTNVYQAELGQIHQNVSAMSICSFNEPSLLLLTTEATEYRTGQLMIFEVRDNQEL